MSAVVKYPEELLLHGSTLYRIDVGCDGVIYGGYHSCDLGEAVTNDRLLMVGINRIFLHENQVIYMT